MIARTTFGAAFEQASVFRIGVPFRKSEIRK